MLKCLIPIPVSVSVAALVVSMMPMAAPAAVTNPPQVTRLVDLECADCPGGVQGLAPRALICTGDEIWLLNEFEPHIRIFEINSQSWRMFGRRGEGPGELNLPMWLGRTHAGEVIVYNGVPSQLVRLDPEDGSLLKVLRISPRMLISASIHPSTETLYTLTFFFGDKNSRLDRLNITSGKSVTLLPDTDEHPKIPGTEDDPLITRGRFPLAAFGDGGFVIGDAWGYVIKAYDTEGILVRQFGREMHRPRLSVEFDGLPLEADLPHFDKFGVDWDQTNNVFWVRTYYGHPDQETVFDLFNATGEFLGHVSVPTATNRGFASFDAEGNRLVTWAEDEFGNGRLTLWRIDWN